MDRRQLDDIPLFKQILTKFSDPYQSQWANNATFYLQGLILITVCISNRIYSKVWVEITYQFPNATVEVSEWISNLLGSLLDMLLLSHGRIKVKPCL